MAKNNYPNRTTLWDDLPSPDANIAAPPPATTARGAWRAPSAVLSSDAGRRRAVSAMPILTDFEEDTASIPRRTKSKASSIPSRPFILAKTWWRPRTTFGRILLGMVLLVLLAILVTTGILTRNFLTRDHRFRIPGASSIQSTGLSEVNRAQLLPVFGEDIGRNIFFVPLSERRQQLESIPWVQQATVMRILPDQLRVNIVERTPVAFVRQGSQIELADADGVILSMPPAMMAQHRYSFPVITGIDGKNRQAARQRMAVYQRFLAELDQNHQHLADQVSEIDLSDPEDLRATMPEQGSDILAHFGEDQFLHRLQVYKTHIAEWRQRYPRLKGVDLRYNGEVPLEMDTRETTDPADANASAASSQQAAIAAPAIQATARTVPPPAKSTTATAKKPQPKSTASTRKAAEAKARAAKLKAAKLKAAHKKAAQNAAAHNPTLNQ